MIVKLLKNGKLVGVKNSKKRSDDQVLFSFVDCGINTEQHQEIFFNKDYMYFSHNCKCYCAYGISLQIAITPQEFKIMDSCYRDGWSGVKKDTELKVYPILNVKMQKFLDAFKEYTLKLWDYKIQEYKSLLDNPHYRDDIEDIEEAIEKYRAYKKRDSLVESRLFSFKKDFFEIIKDKKQCVT